mgnify:CR=1 FL=1
MAIYFNKTWEDKLYDKYGDKFFLFFYPFALYTIIVERYLHILVFDGLVYITIILLRHKSNFLNFYYRRIITIFWMITLLFSAVTLVLFEQENYLYMAKAYIECDVLELKEYSFVHRDKDHLIYMIKKHDHNEDDFNVIENLVGEIDSYILIKENKYEVNLKNKKEIDIEFSNYDYFTLIDLDIY